MDFLVVDTPTIPSRFDNWTFEWGDVDTTNGGICGAFKCFFLSRACPQSLGYLVVTENAETSFKKGQRAKEFGEALQEQYPSIKVLTPWKVEIRYMSEDHTERLNSDLYLLKNGDISNKGWFREGRVTVYTVPTAPTPHYQIKRLLFGNKVANLVKRHMEANPDFNLTMWKENFQTSVDLIVDLLPEEPCIAKDFQVLLEIPTGHLWHFDLDRCFEGHETRSGATVTKLIYHENAIRECMRKLHSWPHLMENAFKKLHIQ
jgi:hypothetical protein